MKNSISQNSEFLDKEIGNFSNILLQYTFILSSFLKSINIIEERHSNAYQKGTLFVRSVSALTYQHLHIINTIDNIIEDTDNKC